MTTLLIFILLKLFANPTLHLNLTSLKHSIFIKIIITMLSAISPSLFYQIVGYFTFSPDSFFSRLQKHLTLLFSYQSIPWLLLFPLGYSDNLYTRTEFSIYVCTDHGMLMLPKLQYAIFLTFIGTLNIVHSSVIFNTKY